MVCSWGSSPSTQQVPGSSPGPRGRAAHAFFHHPPFLPSSGDGFLSTFPTNPVKVFGLKRSYGYQILKIELLARVGRARGFSEVSIPSIWYWYSHFGCGWLIMQYTWLSWNILTLWQGCQLWLRIAWCKKPKLSICTLTFFVSFDLGKNVKGKT